MRSPTSPITERLLSDIVNQIISVELCDLSDALPQVDFREQQSVITQQIRHISPETTRVCVRDRYQVRPFFYLVLRKLLRFEC